MASIFKSLISYYLKIWIISSSYLLARPTTSTNNFQLIGKGKEIQQQTVYLAQITQLKAA